MTDRTDNFNRTDSTTSLGTPSDSGSAWVAQGGTWGILSNQGYKPLNSSSQQIATLESSVSNVEVQATFAVMPATWGAGLNARAADNSNYLLLNANATLIELYKVVAGAFTQLGTTFNGTLTAGDVLKLRVDSANLITAYQNGTSRVSATDAVGSANTKHGLRDYRGAAASVSFDTFSITAIVSAAFIAQKPRVISQAIQSGIW